MIDTHCHLNLGPLADDVAGAVRQAAVVGVERIIVPGVSVATSLLAVEVSKQFATVYAAVGIHPQEDGSGSVSDIEKLLQDEPTVVAVGEVGLDFSNGTDGSALQYSRFEAQVLLAKKYGKPVIVHSRDAYSQTAEVLHAIGYSNAVIHCFTGTYDQACTLLNLGCLISVTGIITYPSAAALREAVSRMPLSQLMLETDAPYLAPNTHRGQSNKPEYLPEVAHVLATLKGVSVQKIDTVTTATAERFFSLPHA